MNYIYIYIYCKHTQRERERHTNQILFIALILSCFYINNNMALEDKHSGRRQYLVTYSQVDQKISNEGKLWGNA